MSLELGNLYYIISAQTAELKRAEKDVAKMEKQIEQASKEKIKVQVATEQVKKAEAEVKKLSGEVKKLSSQAKQTSNSVTESFRNIATGIGVAYTASKAWDVIMMADNFNALQGRIADSSKSIAEFNANQIDLIAISKETGTELATNVSVFQSLSDSAKDLGKSRAEVLTFLETVNKLGAIGGTSTANMQAGLLQLGQALSGDVVRAEEFNSVVENLRPLAQLAADNIDRFGGSISKMRKEMIDGKLGSVEFFNAVLQGSEGVEKRFSALPPRISIATNAFTLAWMEYVNGADEATSVTGIIASGIMTLSNHIPELVGGVVTLTSAWVGYKSVGIATALYDGVKAMLAFNVAMTANPIGLVVAGIATLSAGLYFFGDDIKVTEDGMVSLQDVFVVGWDAISDAVSDAVSVMTSLWNSWGSDFRAVAGEAYDFVMGGFSDLVAFYKNRWNDAIGIFIGAYKSIVDIWTGFAPALADIVLTAVNHALQIIEGFVNGAISYVNYAIEKANSLSSMLGGGDLVPEIGNVDLGRIENDFAGAGASLGNKLMSNFEGALDTNYLGMIGDKFGSIADDVLEKARQVAEARKSAEGTSLGGGGGGGSGGSPATGGAEDKEAKKEKKNTEAEKALRERLALEEEFAKMRAEMVTNEYDRELAQEALAQQKRLETIAEFNAKGIGTQAERHALLIASEEIYSAKILEIEAQREQAKIDLQNEFRQFRAEGMVEELAMNLELETLAYEERLAKLEEFNNELILSDQELAELKEAELASHQARVAELEKKDAERKKKLEEETYKATFGAKLAYALKAKGLAKALSSDEAKAFVGGLEESMDAFAQHSKGMFEAQKALSVAKAVMAGYEATIGAYAYGSTLGGPALGAVFAGIAVASTAMQIAGIMSSQYSGGRKQGGSVSQNSMYRVAENSRPELLTMGSNTYLMTGSQGGTVTPNNKIPEFMMPKMSKGGGGAGQAPMMGGMVNITIRNEVAGITFEENRISAGEVEIIARRVTREEAPKIVQSEMSNPNSRSSMAMQRNFKVARNRQ